MKNKFLNQLNKNYSKRIKQLSKLSLDSTDTVLLTLVEHLKYKRDSLIVKLATETPETDPATDTKIASLIIAISEFETYQKSDDAAKKAFHWNNFWEFVKLNMEEWLMLNDTV